MTLAIIYLVLAGLGAFFNEVSNDLLALGIDPHITSIIGKAIAASAGVIAAIRALLEAQHPPANP